MKSLTLLGGYKMKIELSEKIASQYKGENITELIENLLVSHFNPRYDLLTKCQSMNMLELDLHCEFRNKRNFRERFLCVDIDNLVDLKDNYGHAAGDAGVLVVANGLKNIYKEEKIYRYGGNEFVVWISDENVTKIEIDNAFIEKYREIQIKYCELIVDISENTRLFRTVNWIMNQMGLSMLKASVNGSKIICGNPPDIAGS